MAPTSPSKPRLVAATAGDAPAIAALRTAAGEQLGQRYGSGHWSRPVSEKSVGPDLRVGRVFVLREGASIIATLTLAIKKPWAIDPTYFTDALRPLYLRDMAVAPRRQRFGIGRMCIKDAIRLARAWPSDSIRLDAYEGPVGAGSFYEKCGFRERGRVMFRETPLVYYELVL
jgi:GNAT superfamily N-acetyltransferase